MREHLAQPLLPAPGVVYTCQQSGACCRNDWLIGVDEPARERLSAVDWARAGLTLPPGSPFAPLPFALPGGERTTFERTPDGACVFLDRGARCAIHRLLGAAAKPQVCREFPHQFVESPDGIVVGVSFACTAVRTHRGQPLAAQQAEIAEVLAGSTRVRRLPDPLVLYSTLEIGWPEYRALEAALLALLGDTGSPLPVVLVAGSALVSVCVGIAELAARARRAGAPAAETLTGALARLADERYRRLLAIAAAARPPRRPSLASLAPLYTWLELSRTRTSRVGLVLALYRNYLRFRRGRGAVPDLVTGGAPLDLVAVSAVRFDASHPEIDAFLREYWTHVVVRKTLVPLHGVFRGWQTLLLLHAFTRWTARVAALRRGRGSVDVEDVRDAVRLVEQRLVLHARFADLFALSPVLTVMADRLFRDPAFVRGAVLDPTPDPVS